MSVRLVLFVVGAGAVALAGFLSPVWWTGFVIVGAALIWLSLNVEVEPDGATDTPKPPRRR